MFCEAAAPLRQQLSQFLGHQWLGEILEVHDCLRTTPEPEVTAATSVIERIREACRARQARSTEATSGTSGATSQEKETASLASSWVASVRSGVRPRPRARTPPAAVEEVAAMQVDEDTTPKKVADVEKASAKSSKSAKSAKPDFELHTMQANAFPPKVRPSNSVRDTRNDWLEHAPAGSKVFARFVTTEGMVRCTAYCLECSLTSLVVCLLQEVRRGRSLPIPSQG